MSNTKTKLKAVSTTRHDNNYYVGVLDSIRQLGYFDPSTDTDERQRLVWQELVTGGYSLQIITKHGLRNLAPHSDPNFKFFQTRAKSEGEVKEYFQQFYLLKKRLERIIFGMILNGDLFIFLGNRRVRAHEMGIGKGFDSLCDVVIVDREGMTIDSKLTLAGKLARMGNKRVNSVRDEVPLEDYPHQLKNEYDLLCRRDPTALAWTEEELLAWARKWVTDEHPEYLHPCKKSALGNIVNTAFSNHRGQSIPLPLIVNQNQRWQGSWPNDTWDPENGGSKVTQFVVATGRKLRSALTTPWAQRDPFTTNRKPAWILARCGSSIDSKVTDRTAVKAERTAFLTRAVEFNANVNHVGAGYPLVTKIMFIQQISGGKCEAYEWNVQTEEFDKK